MKLPFSLSKAFAGLSLVAAPFMMKGQSGDAYASADNRPPVETPTAAKTAAISANTKSITGNPETNLNAPIVIVGDVVDALRLSVLPDNSYVGVCLIVDKDCAKTPEQIIDKIFPFFNAHNLPVKFVKQANPAEGIGFAMRIYVGGESYDGDMTNGNVTWPEFRDNHPVIAAKLKAMYAAANPVSQAAYIPQQN